MHGASSAFVLDIHELAVAGHAVKDPCVVERARAYLRTPPLVGDGVGEEAYAALVAYARAENSGEFGRPDGGESVVRELDDVEMAGLRRAEAVRKEVILLCGRLC